MLKTNNPVMYSDPSGLAPKKEKREAKLLDASDIYSESDLGHFGMLNEMFALQMEESRRSQDKLEEQFFGDWEEFDRWQAVTRNKMNGGGGGDKYDNSYDLALAAENKKKLEAKEKENKERGNVEEESGIPYSHEYLDKLKNTPWMVIAEAELGVTEIPGSEHNPRIMEYLHSTVSWFDEDEDAWCASFVNWSLEQVGINGIEGVDGSRAVKWINWDGGESITEPAYGAIAVFKDKGSSYQGHLAFVGGQTPNGQLLFLGGNQSDMVNYSLAWRNKILLGYKFPAGYMPNYNLPIIYNYRRAGGTR